MRIKNERYKNKLLGKMNRTHFLPKIRINVHVT